MTWFEAKDHCKRKGAKLVEIDSEEENRALAEKINNRGYTDKNMNFWIGLSDVDNEGVWKLASDNSIATYLNWGDGQPNNGGGNEDCARLRMGRPEWKEKWSDFAAIKIDPATIITSRCMHYVKLKMSHQQQHQLQQRHLHQPRRHIQYQCQQKVHNFIVNLADKKTFKE